MRKSIVISSGLLAVVFLSLGGCPPATTIERNPFITLAEVFGVPSGANPDELPGGGGTPTVGQFRRTMTVTFQNNHVDAELATSFVAWVEVSSIRSADDQDALLRSGYVQLTREVRLGSVFSLPPGTFVYNGPGVAGATAVRLGPTDADTVLPTSRAFDLTTPDVILTFVQPPTSCESVAFAFIRDGDVVFDDDGFLTVRTFAEGGFKTLAQVDAYQCDPLRPGVFLKRGGGARQADEFFEGESVTFDFFENPDANGDFGFVTIVAQPQP